MSIAIKVEHVSKEYRLGAINHGMLYKDIQSWMARRLGRPDPHAVIGHDHFADREDHFWALKDIDLEISQGQRIGIIGKNGAGKSTLLKILSRITAPTEGVIRIKGRVTSLLEVGTGFHGELSGRENIYLNGAILGMKRREIDRKIDEIIAFSEIENYIDTPVKRYSSGMYVRLAFAVAAHLESDILIADEVLAVGDAMFQKKALGKMQDLSTGQGRTVLFVSHQMNAVSALCDTGVILEKGRVAYESGNIADVIAEYLRPLKDAGKASVWENNGEFSDPNFTPERMSIVNDKLAHLEEVQRSDRNIHLMVEATIKEQNALLNVGVSLHKATGELVLSTWMKDVLVTNQLKNGRNVLYIRLPVEILNLGEYTVSLSAGLHHTAFIIKPDSRIPMLTFRITGSIGTDYGDDTREGLIVPLIPWKREL